MILFKNILPYILSILKKKSDSKNHRGGYSFFKDIDSRIFVGLVKLVLLKMVPILNYLGIRNFYNKFKCP